MTSRKINISQNQDELLEKYLAEHALRRQESKEQYRKIVQAGIAKWISDFQKGNIVINSVSDLRQLIEIDLQLQEEDT
jgi:uncharacterized protein YbcV (DUF1398 family)